MGNNVQQRQSSCLGCMASNELNNFDCYELNINLDNNQPKGKITQQSTAQLSKDEINFFNASSGRNVSLLRIYLNMGVSINTVDEERTSILHVASRHGSIQVIEELIQNNANINLTDMAGWTPLHVAVYYQRSQVCQMLIQAGADISIRTRDGKIAQDLVRDQMTMEVFKGFDKSVEDSQLFIEQNSDSSKIRVMKQQENAKEQYDDYFRNMKRKLSIHQFSLNLDKSPNKLYEREGTHPRKILNERNQSISNLNSPGVGNTLQIPKYREITIASDRNSPSQSQRSVFAQAQDVVMQEQDALHLTTLITLKQNDLPCFQNSCFDVFQSSSNHIHRIGASIFRDHSILGLSFMILTKQVKPQIEDVATLLVQDEFIKCSNALGDLFSNPNFYHGPKILDCFIGELLEESLDYIKALRQFFKWVSYQNDPFKLDCLVTGISRNFFRIFRKRPFKSEAALHMFTFAILVLDKAIMKSFSRSQLEYCIQDFMNNIQGINDGFNFDQKYINNVIDEIRRTPIAQTNYSDLVYPIKETINQISDCIKVMKKKKNSQIIEYELYKIENLIFLLTNQKIKIIECDGLKFYYEGEKELTIKSQCIVASSKQMKTFEVKSKKNIKYTFADQLDYSKFLKLF